MTYAGDYDYLSPHCRERIGYYVQRFYTFLGSRRRFYWMVEFSWWLNADWMSDFRNSDIR